MTALSWTCLSPWTLSSEGSCRFFEAFLQPKPWAVDICRYKYNYMYLLHIASTVFFWIDKALAWFPKVSMVWEASTWMSSLKPDLFRWVCQTSEVRMVPGIGGSINGWDFWKHSMPCRRLWQSWVLWPASSSALLHNSVYSTIFVFEWHGMHHPYNTKTVLFNWGLNSLSASTLHNGMMETVDRMLSSECEPKLTSNSKSLEPACN